MHQVVKALETLMTLMSLTWGLHPPPLPRGSRAPDKLSCEPLAPSLALLVVCLSPVLLVILPLGQTSGCVEGG